MKASAKLIERFDSLEKKLFDMGFTFRNTKDEFNITMFKEDVDKYSHIIAHLIV